MEHFGTIGRILGMFTLLSVFQVYQGPGTNVEVSASFEYEKR